MFKKCILWLLCCVMLLGFAPAETAVESIPLEPEFVALETPLISLFYNAEEDVFTPHAFDWNADREESVAALPHSEVFAEMDNDFHSARVLTAEDGRISYCPLAEYIFADSEWVYTADYEFGADPAGLIRCTFTASLTAEEAAAQTGALTSLTKALLDAFGQPDFASATAITDYSDADITTVHSRLAWYRGETFLNIGVNYVDDIETLVIYVGTGLREYNAAFAAKAE